MAKRQTAIKRNISHHKRLASSNYCSYFMFGDAGFELEFFTSSTTV